MATELVKSAGVFEAELFTLTQPFSSDEAAAFKVNPHKFMRKFLEDRGHKPNMVYVAWGEGNEGLHCAKPTVEHHKGCTYVVI